MKRSSLSHHHASKLITFFLFALCVSSFIATARARAFIAQITPAGSPLSPLYFISNFSIGSPPQPETLLISTDSPSFPWIECSRGGAFDPRKSSSFSYSTCFKLPSTCSVGLTPYKLRGRLAADTFSLHRTNGSSQGHFVPSKNVQFACVEGNAGSGLGFTGVASLSASNESLPAQLAEKGVAKKFAYCLPPAGSARPGPIFFGDGIRYMFGSPPIMDISAFLATATLIVDRSGLLSLGLQNITVDGESLSIRKPLKLRISSVEPYTKLSRHVYVALRESFRAKAAVRGLGLAAPVSPFDTCFNASTIGFSRVGPYVPTIELALQGNVAWAIFGFNSIVSVSEAVSCWAFVDAGAHQPSVLGTFQQHDNLLEFDLLNKKLRFSGVLDYYRTLCQDFNF